MKIVRKFSQRLIFGAVFFFIQEIKGYGNLPRNTGYIVASNHASHIDPFAISSVVFKRHGRIVHYIGKKESLDYLIWRFMYKTFGVIPIDRFSKSNGSLDKALSLLKSNKIIGIFPEGTRTPNGKIHAGKTGVARLVIRSKKQIVPVAIKNTYEIWPKHKKIPKIMGIIRINIGRPVTYSIGGKKVSKKTLRTITESIMKKISKLYSELG